MRSDVRLSIITSPALPARCDPLVAEEVVALLNWRMVWRTDFMIRLNVSKKAISATNSTDSKSTPIDFKIKSIAIVF